MRFALPLLLACSDEQGDTGGWERCNGVDDDSDGLVDMLDPDIVYNPYTEVWYPDADQDGWGLLPQDATGPAYGCGELGPSGWSSHLDGDCDESRAYVYPGALEECDGLDNDCNGEVDDNCVTSAPPDESR